MNRTCSESPLQKQQLSGRQRAGARVCTTQLRHPAIKLPPTSLLAGSLPSQCLQAPRVIPVPRAGQQAGTIHDLGRRGGKGGGGGGGGGWYGAMMSDLIARLIARHMWQQGCQQNRAPALA